MRDGIAWASRVPELSRRVGPPAGEQAGERQGAADRQGFAALVEGSGRAAAPSRGPSEAREPTEAKHEPEAEPEGSASPADEEDVQGEVAAMPQAEAGRLPVPPQRGEAGEAVVDSVAGSLLDGFVPGQGGPGEPLRSRADGQVPGDAGAPPVASTPVAGLSGADSSVAGAILAIGLQGEAEDSGAEARGARSWGAALPPGMLRGPGEEGLGPLQGEAVPTAPGPTAGGLPGQAKAPPVGMEPATTEPATTMPDPKRERNTRPPGDRLALVSEVSDLSPGSHASAGTLAAGASAGEPMVPVRGAPTLGGRRMADGAKGGDAVSEEPGADMASGRTETGEARESRLVRTSGLVFGDRVSAMPPAVEPSMRESERGLSGDQEADSLAPSSPVGAAGPAPLGPPEVSPDARRIARQVAAHPVLQTGGSAELSLALEELGHLRLSVDITDSGLRVIIEASRPETADLMRRQVEVLRHELRQEGLGSVGVSISGGEGQRGRDPAPDRQPGGGWPAAAASGAGAESGLAPLPSTGARLASAAGRIDLRF